MIAAVLQLVLVLVVLGVIWFLLDRYVSPIHPAIRIIINVLFVILIILILLNAVGLAGGLAIGTPVLFRVH